MIQAAPTPQTYDDDSFEFEETAAPTKLPWYSQDRARKLASKHHKERREAVLRQKEAQRKHRETVEKRLERVQQTILRRRRDRQGTFRKGSAVLVKEKPKHEKTLNWKPETAWRPGPYPNPQKTSMARTRLFGPPPVDSKNISGRRRGAQVADAAAAEDRGRGRGLAQGLVRRARVHADG